MSRGARNDVLGNYITPLITRMSIAKPHELGKQLLCIISAIKIRYIFLRQRAAENHRTKRLLLGKQVFYQWQMRSGVAEDNHRST